MAATRARFTEEDLAAMPDDGRRYELYDGEIYVSPAPVPAHQRVSSKCHGHLLRAEAAGYGVVLAAPIEVKLRQGRVVQPDLIFIRRERLAIIGETQIVGAPDLVVEIVSPSSRKRDLGWKLRAYEAEGVPFYWAVDPKGALVLPHTLRDGRYVTGPALRAGDRLGCPLFPDIVLDDVARLFA